MSDNSERQVVTLDQISQRSERCGDAAIAEIAERHGANGFTISDRACLDRFTLLRWLDQTKKDAGADAHRLISEKLALLSQVEALRQYAQHKPNCAAIADFRADEPCTCGLSTVKGEV